MGRRRLKVGTDRGDKKLAKKLIGFIERDKWKKIKKFISEENIHPGSVLKPSRRQTGLHLAAKMGSEGSLRVLLKLGADPTATDKRGDFPLHLAAIRCLRHLSRTLIEDLVEVLTPHCSEILDKPNSRGTTCRQLLEGLQTKLSIEEEKSSRFERPEASPDESSTSSDLDDDFRQRLDDEAGQEYFEFEGKFRDYDTKDFSEETYNDWADRIFAEFRRKTRPVKPEASAAAAEARLPETPKKTLKLKPPEKKDTSIKKDLYLFKFKKLFRSKEAIALRDLPFSLTSTSEEIVGTILSAEDADSRKHLREALRVWHPDKFNQLTQGRVSEEADRKAMSEIVTHVSQVLINYGKTKV